MRKILLGFVALSFLVEPSLVMADARKPVEPQGAAREAQYKKVTEICRKKYSEWARFNLVARWESHYGKTGWWCGL